MPVTVHKCLLYGNVMNVSAGAPGACRYTLLVLMLLRVLLASYVSSSIVIDSEHDPPPEIFSRLAVVPL